MRVLPACVLLLSAAALHGNRGAGAQSLSFTIQRVSTSPLSFSIRIDEATGTGVYRQLQGEPEGTTQATKVEGGPAAMHETPIVVRPPLLKKLFAAVPMVKGQHCETHSKGLAQTGRKTLRYLQDDVAVECSYNYSDDERVNTATSLFEALGETMVYGDRLTQKLRFDRLGLDSEIEGLRSEVAEGRALEVGNIALVLKAIIDDDRVMDHVRRKASHLLEGAIANPAQAEEASPSMPR